MSNKRIRKVAVVGVLMIIMGAKEIVSKIDADNITGRVTASILNVRSGSLTSHKVVCKVTKRNKSRYIIVR